MVTGSIFFDRFCWEKVFCAGEENGTYFFKDFQNFLESYYRFSVFSRTTYMMI